MLSEHCFRHFLEEASPGGRLLLLGGDGGGDAEGFAFGDGADAVVEVAADGFGGETLEGLVHGLAAEAEGAVVHRDHEAGVEVEEGADGFLGGGVY